MNFISRRIGTSLIALNLIIPYFHIASGLKTVFSSVQFSCSVVFDSLRPHESQHARPPCPSPTPRFHSDSRPSSPWCHPAISSSLVLFSSCPQSLPASKSFPMSQLFSWGGQSTGVSASASVLPMNTLAMTIREENRNKRNPNWKRRSKTLTVCRWHDPLHRKP